MSASESYQVLPEDFNGHWYGVRRTLIKATCKSVSQDLYPTLYISCKMGGPSDNLEDLHKSY